MRARLFSILGHILVCASAREKEGTKARPPAFLLLRMLRRRALPSKSASAACGRFIIANFADGETHATPDFDIAFARGTSLSKFKPVANKNMKPE